jgi:hypothetical protein
MGYTISKLLVSDKDPRKKEYDENMSQYMGGGDTSRQTVPDTVFKQDIRLDDMSLRQFVHNVPVQSIEDSVVKILEKYGLVNQSPHFYRDGTTNFIHDATYGYVDATIGYPINGEESEKTFTLDEVIKIIESTQSTTQVVSVFNQWDNNAIVEAYKNQLIETFKIL